MDGFSTIKWRNQSIYIKHHNFRDQAMISSDFEKYKADAIIRGVPTEDVAIQEAIGRGDWSEEKEEEIKRQENKIEGLTKAAQQMKIPSQKEQQLAVIESVRDKIKDKQAERQELIINSAENLAYIRANNRFMEKIIFVDKDFREIFLEGEHCSEEDFATIRNLQISLYSTFHEDNISRAVLRDFFNPFLAFSDDPMKFFGIPAVHLTVFQLKLISYARMFKNVFENTRNIPDIIRYDPNAIVQFVQLQQDEQPPAHTFARKQKSDHGARTYFGAKHDDLVKMKGADEKIVNLGEQVKKHGGSMDMQQMMEMTGIDK